MHTSSSDISLVRTLLTVYLSMFLVLTPAAQLLAGEPVSVRVSGIEGDALKNVEAALVIPAGIVKDGTVDKLWLEHFVRQADGRVRKALEPFGYYGPRITTSLEGSGKTEQILLVTVAAGEPTRLTEVKLKLQGPGSAEPQLLEKVASFPLRRGDILLHELYGQATDDLLATARKLGYLDTVLSVHEIQVDPATMSARIIVVLESGPRYLFGEATIEGATYYPEELLRRYVSFTAGEPFSYKALGQTQLNFAGSAYFKNINIIPDKEAASELRVPVTIQVVPAPRRTIRPGIGYGTDTGARASVSYKDLSLLYPGNILNTEITVAEKLQGIGSSYTIPSRQSMETFSTIQLNLQRENVNDTVSRLASLELSRTTGFGDHRLGTAFIRLQQEQYSVGVEDNTSHLLLPGLRFSQRSYDDLIRPKQGYHYALETLGTVRALGSDASFIQFTAEAGGIIALPWRTSLKTRAKGGATILDDPFADLPTSLRFFAGGDSSVRGYSYKSLGPRDASGEVVGGRNLLQGSIELERSLFSKWAISIFYDTGNAFDVSRGFKLYQGAGVGVHYFTPIGEINLNLARQLDVPDPKFRIHFTIGFLL